MILDKLFRQYKKGRKPSFGSRFGSFWAKLLIGTPKDKNLGSVFLPLQISFYNRPADRWPPRDEEGLRQWETDSKLVTDTRTIEEPIAAKAASLGALVIILVLVGAAQLIHSTKIKSNGEGGEITAIVSTPSGQPTSVNAAELPQAQIEACRRFATQLKASGGQDRQLQSLMSDCRLKGFNE